MAYTDTTWTAALVAVSDMNTSVRDNFRFFYAGVGFTATKSAQTVASGSWTKLQCNTEVWDSHGYYDNATNYRFTPLIAGKYLVTVGAYIPAGNGNTGVAVYKNGAVVETIGQIIPLPGVQSVYLSGTGVLDFNGSTDYIDIYVLHNTGSDQSINGNFSAHRIGT